MPETRYPRLNKPYAAYILIAGVGSGIFLTYIGIYNSADIGASAIAIVVALVSVFGAIYIVRQASRLEVGDSGISSGKTKIEWHEVEDIKTVGYGLHLKAGSRKIILAPYAYHDPEKLLLYIQKAVSNAS